MGVELHVRYRAGRDGARIVFRDGSVVQLAPFAPFRFETMPRRIEGQLRRWVTERERKA
jgi:hypothetical protein